MSSTQMDLSPLGMDRKQDIASWPEGDIEQLAVRDKNRYQKRKSAIIDYFKSDLSVEEISARHHLSAIDVLETMARRCCMLHEDGKSWGFRALVPGARVVDTRPISDSEILSEHCQNGNATVASMRTELFTENGIVQPGVEGKDKKRDTDEHPAITSKDFVQLPQTPLPAGRDEQAEATIIKAKQDVLARPVRDDEAEAVEPEVVQEEFPVLTPTADEEVPQEEFPCVMEEAEDTPAAEEVEQEEFPVAASEMEQAAAEEVEQEEFLVAASEMAVVGCDEETQEEHLERTEEAERGEFLAPVSEVEAVASEEVLQEEFPGVAEEADDTATLAEGEVEQQELPTPTDDVSDAEEADDTVTLAEGEVEQQEFPTPMDDVSGSEELASEGEDDDPEGEPTVQLPVVKPVPSQTAEATEDESSAETEVEALPTATLKAVLPDQTDESGAVAEDEKVAELDTVEVAQVGVDERLDRVAALETIKVPAAMLDVLEKADQDLQAREEEAVAEIAVEAEAAATSPALPESAATVADEKATTLEEDVAELPTQTMEAWKRDSGKQAQVSALKSPTQSLAEDSRYRITGSQVAIKHAVRRRWGKQGRQQKYQRWTRIISAAIIVSLLVILLIPLGVGLAGYNAYTNIKSVADDGVKNLLSLNELIPADKTDVLAALNTQKLATGKASLQKAQSDFLQLQDMVNRPDIETLLQQVAPQYSNELDMARRLVQTALDVTRMGQELIGVAQMGATIIHGSGALLSSSATTPLLSADNINTIQAALVHAQYYIGDIRAQMSQVNMAQIPFGSAAQKNKLAGYLTQLPQAQDMISQVQTLIGPVAWLLGIGQARHLLVQTLDRGELRASGGFEGQYGVLTLQNGHMSPFSLKDITLIDYAGNGNELGAAPPPQYSWMNFGFFGVRDANLSADFPTTAKIVMNYFQAEGGGPVDGVIQITPVIIEQFLDLTGPLSVKEYHETITSKNLETKLHAYQQDPRLIQDQVNKTGTDTHSTRKAFTNLVGTLLMDRIKHMSPTVMMNFGKVLLNDLKSRDLQIYLNNPAAEQWLAQNHNDGAMPRYTKGMDGFMVVQSNISISKAAQYVKSTFKDDVKLDASGGATHNLTITLNYQRNGQPVYGYDTYADYLRVYAPANARLIDAYGFSTGSVLCTPGRSTPKTGGKGKVSTVSSSGSSYVDSGVVVSGCGQYDSTFPDTAARYCPDGNYRLGYDGMAARAWPVQNLGGPSTKSSDLSGYAMWGGMTLTPKDCISTLKLSWYVPHIVQNTPGQAPYQMIVGHQAGWPVTAQVSIHASALQGNIKDVQFKQTIIVDTLVSLAPRPSSNQPAQPGSTPTPAVTPTATPKRP